MTAPEFETLRIAHPADHVAVVTLHRPEASNALNTQMGRDLVRVFEDMLPDSRDVRCVVLTGAGERAFCAGGDLRERRGMTNEAWTLQHLVFERMVRALIDCPIAVIGALNGAAYGGDTAGSIASNAPVSVRQAKQSIHRGLQMSLRDGLAFEIEAYNRLVPTEDRREGILAFNEKRRPNFAGR